MTYQKLTEMLLEAGSAVRSKVYESLKSTDVEVLSAVHAEKEEDTIYHIDREVEDILIPILEKYASAAEGFIVLAEGIGEDSNGIVLPLGSDREKAKYKVIIDPIDGTRGIMYNKRSAFFLAGIAPNKGESTSLQDVEVAAMVELPTTKQYLADVLWAVKGKGAFAQTHNLINGESKEKKLKPSSAKTIIGGFAQFARFFPPGRDILSKIEDELIQTIKPNNPGGKALVFEDQYISSGGQLFELLNGHDRFIADVRGLLYKLLKSQGKEGGHVCHPYDVCAHLIGAEAGIIITDGEGKTLDVPLNLSTEVDWMGFANRHIYNEVFPIVQSLMKKYNLL
ncbi:inositol monophosphatase family protein [Chryseosolibacter indicus]|uniref:Inositol monophosphatase n=1 Tax=Chryseosolibacter indicus TaxID=2782351 RepID=A0ABS5VPG3_9BACT|nr:inositol monophosphatase family protein [Chryseosolibacter indicus]MBT1703330.1 hypothetical protein [Chryseosolibacter indicus]